MSAIIFTDIRDYLKALEDEGELLRIQGNVEFSCARMNSDLDGLTKHLINSEGPAVLIDGQCLKPYNTPDIPVLVNLFGKPKRSAMVVGETDLKTARDKVCGIVADKARWLDPAIVDPGNAPCKEVIIEEDEVNIPQQIPIIYFGQEGSPYICCGIEATKEPGTGVLNYGWYRSAILDVEPEGNPFPEELRRNHLACYIWWNPPSSHIGIHYAKARGAGGNLEIAIACVNDPSLHLAAGTGLAYGPHEWDAIAYAGALRGQPVEMVKCETVDLHVPANAEIIIEGEVIPKDVREGPHGNYLGTYDPPFTLPLVKVKCITRRQKPIWYASHEMRPPFDHAWLANLTWGPQLFAELTSKFPWVADAAIYPTGWGNVYAIQLSTDAPNKPYPGIGKSICHAVWGAAERVARWIKVIFVVGPDIDIHNPADILFALATRWQPQSDSVFTQTQSTVVDPSAPFTAQMARLITEAIGIDATIKVPERFTEMPFVDFAVPTAEAIEKAGRKIAPFIKK
ncbi:MAG: UbiD family decarboxylase [Desulfatiglandales bacterium]